MKQYLLSIYQPDGVSRRRSCWNRSCGRCLRLVQESEGRRRVGVQRRPAHRRARRRSCASEDEDVHDDGRAVHRGQRAHRRLPDHQGAGPRRGARMGAASWRGRSSCRASRRALPFESRARSHTEEDQRRHAASAQPTRCVRSIERIFREEYGRAVAVLVRLFGDIDVAEEAVQDAFTMAVRAVAVRADCRRARRAGSSPPPATGRSTACAARRRARTGTPRPPCCSRDEPTAARRTRARRPAAADLHLLPSRAGAERAGRADAAAARRPDDRPRSRARSSCPSRRWRSAGARQGQDPRRAASPTASRTRPTSPSACAPCSPSST